MQQAFTDSHILTLEVWNWCTTRYVTYSHLTIHTILSSTTPYDAAVQPDYITANEIRGHSSTEWGWYDRVNKIPAPLFIGMCNMKWKKKTRAWTLFGRNNVWKDGSIRIRMKRWCCKNCYIGCLLILQLLFDEVYIHTNGFYCCKL
jgi:hypothetical protein